MKPSQLRIPALLIPAMALGLVQLVLVPAAVAQEAPPARFDTPGAGSSPLSLYAASPSPETEAPDDAWHFRLAIPIWVAGFSGDLTIGGMDFTSDQDAGDSFDDLVTNLNGALALHFEAEQGRFGIFVEGMYVDLQTEKVSSAGTSPEATLRAFIGELGGFYTLVTPRPGSAGWGSFRVDVLGGARFTWLELGAKSDDVDEDAEHTLVDPFVGARTEIGLTKWLAYKLRGDIGGFGVGSDLVWNVDTAVEFHVAKWFDIDLGYRWLDYNFEDGSGDERIEFNSQLSGPYVTFQFRF